MTTKLAHQTEWLMSWFINPPNDSAPGQHEWVGPAPRLFFEDDGAAYAAFRASEPDEAGPGYPAVTFAPTTQVRAPLKVRVQIRIIGASESAPFSVGVGIDGAADPEYPPSGWDFTDLSTDTGIIDVPPDGEWHTFEIVPPIDPFDLNWIITDLAPNGRFMAAVSPRTNPHPIYHVSLIEVRVGQTPTRVYPRADGLGMGAPRIMDNRSPYTSARVFGMI